MNNAELRIDARTVDEPGSNYDVTYQSSTTDSWLAETDAASSQGLSGRGEPCFPVPLAVTWSNWKDGDPAET